MKSISALATNLTTIQHQTSSREAYSEPKTASAPTSTKLTKVYDVLVTNLMPLLPVHWPYVVKKYAKAEEQMWLMNEYAEQIVEQGVTSNQLRNGLRKAKQEKWLPTPRDFAALCKPSLEEMGLPDIESAYAQQVERRGKYRGQDYVFSHRVLEIIDERIGYRMYRLSGEDFRELFENSYHYWVGRFINNDLPPENTRFLECFISTKPPIESYMENYGRPVSLGTDTLSQRIKELGIEIKLKNRAR